VHLLRGELERAEESLQQSLEIARADAWIGFQALPEAFLGQVKLELERVDEADDLLEHAFALGCRLGDACYESVAASGLGKLAHHRGDVDVAIDRLRDSRRRLVERPDYVWLEAYALDGLCEVAVKTGHLSAQIWINDLIEIASAGGMKEFLARAYVHRSRLGEEGAIEAAQTIAADVDNPALHELIKQEVLATN
jgi:hypothetical protein